MPGDQVTPGLRFFSDDPDARVGVSGRIVLEAIAFAGSYLSLAIDCPEGAARGLTRQHILAAEVDTEGAATAFARLNLVHEPDTLSIVCPLPDTGHQRAEFDLWTLDFDGARPMRLWLDLIFEPRDSRPIALTGVRLLRYPRAAF